MTRTEIGKGVIFSLVMGALALLAASVRAEETEPSFDDTFQRLQGSYQSAGESPCTVYREAEATYTPKPVSELRVMMDFAIQRVANGSANLQSQFKSVTDSAQRLDIGVNWLEKYEYSGCRKIRGGWAKDCSSYALKRRGNEFELRMKSKEVDAPLYLFAKQWRDTQFKLTLLSPWDSDETRIRLEYWMSEEGPGFREKHYLKCDLKKL